MASITQGQAQQYADSSKLVARARLHQEFSVSEVPWFAWVMSHLPLTPGSQVLDIGCGPAWFWTAGPKGLTTGVNLTLADQSAGMVKEAMERCAALPFASVVGSTADVVALPFDDDSFDVVVAMHMLYHVQDQQQAIAEMYRVLKPGGTLAVTTNGADNLAELYALTTTLGSDPIDPAAVAFGYKQAKGLLERRFGNVEQRVHPASLRVTDPETVFMALTSYPPGDSASPGQLDAFRKAIDEAFAKGDGVLNVRKDTSLFLSKRAH